MPKSLRGYLAFVCGLLVFLALGWWGYLGGAKNAVRSFAQPFFTASDYVQRFAGDSMSVVFHASFNAEESRHIRGENITLRARVAELEYLKRDNRELRAVLRHLDNLEVQAIGARVIVRSATGMEDTLIIDGGSRAGIAVGMPVTAQGDILLGNVTEIANTTAVVKLVSSEREKTEVYLPSSDLVSIAEGEGLGVFAIKVPASFSIQEGEGIFAIGKRDFLLGFADKIEKLDAGAFQAVKSKIPINISEIRQVFVISNL